MMIIFFVIQSWVYDPYTSTKHRKNKKNILTDSQLKQTQKKSQTNPK